LEIWRRRETCPESRRKKMGSRKKMKEKKNRLQYMLYDLLKCSGKKKEIMMEIMQIYYILKAQYVVLKIEPPR
jgi:hypothetical protein